MQAGARPDARNYAGLAVWDCAASDEVRVALLEPVIGRLSLALQLPPLARTPEPVLLVRRFSTPAEDTGSGHDLLMISGSKSNSSDSNSSSGEQSRAGRRSRRRRVPRERSISQPFLKTRRQNNCSPPEHQQNDNNNKV
jgi:hypothetical protein